MRWTPRQQSMLQAMGIRLWNVDSAHAETPAAPESLGGGMPPLMPERQAGVAAREVRAAEPTHGGARAGPQVGELPPGIAAMEWPALREAVASCTACSLCRTRRNTVFGVGNLRARWMIVGEAPGEQEDLRGEPFVGKSGHLLDAMLHAVGLTRATGTPANQVFIANTLKCRPPSNRNPEPGELATCEPFLVRQIELVQPGVILAMGRFAVQALLCSNEPIGRLRGRAHRYQGVPLVVTYHPAYLLRNPPDKARAWEDLCFARSLLGEPRPT